MTLLFLFPRFLWHAFPRKSGINIRRLVFTIKNNIQSDNDINNAKHILKVYLDRQSGAYRGLRGRGDVGPTSSSKKKFCFSIKKTKVFHKFSFGLQRTFLKNQSKEQKKKKR